MNQKFLAFLTHFLVLLAAILLLRLDTVLSKFAFVKKFSCANLALKTSAAKVVIYLSWSWLLSLFSIFVILVLYSVFLTRLQT